MILFRIFRMFIISIVILFYNTFAFCAEQNNQSIISEFVNYYNIVLYFLGVDEKYTHDWSAVVGSLFVMVLLIMFGLLYKKSVEKEIHGYEPDSYFSIKMLIEVILDAIHNLVKDVIGEEAERFFPILASIFVFILFCNLSGLVPGFPPATENISTNLALGLIVFFYYHYQGIRVHGIKYIKQFLGPVWWLAPILIFIELASHLVRPISLSLRLYGNIFGDHLVLSVFTGLSYIIIPAFLLFFGLLVAIVQSLVFTLLSTVYISLAISHDH